MTIVNHPYGSSTVKREASHIRSSVVLVVCSNLKYLCSMIFTCESYLVCVT